MSFKWKKFFVRVGVALIVLLALGIMVRAVLNYSTGKKLSRTVRAFKENAIPLTLAEIEPECADKNNAAVHWRAAESLTLPGENRKLLYQTLKTLFSGEFPGKEDEETLRDMTREFYPFIQFIREASSKPCFKYEHNWSEQGASMPIPNAIKMILAIRLLAVDAVLKAQNGQVEEAVEECLDGFRFILPQLKSPYLISYLISVANMKVIFVSLRWILLRHEIDAEQLENVRKYLDIGTWREGLIWAWETERALIFDIGVKVINGEEDFFWEKKMLNLNGFFSWWLKPLFKAELVWLLKFWQEVIPELKKSYFEIENPERFIEKKIESVPWYFRIAGLLLPNLAAVKLKLTTLEAMLITAQVGIACRMYKRESGLYPKMLNELRPAYLTEIPLDPFTGKPLFYSITQNGFLVYSLGANKKDDGGRSNLEITKMIMDKDDDWSWEKK